MTRMNLAKLLGGLALLAPWAGSTWAGEKNGQSAVQIYTTDSVVQQAVGQQTAPETATPAATEGKEAPAAACGAACDSGGLLSEVLHCYGLGSWLDCNRVAVSGHLEQSYTINDKSPTDRQNFGRLFDDRSNDYRLNQILITFERALCPQPCCTDWGFKAQFMYGSDARFIHSLGFMDNITDETVQPDIVELYWSYHMPILTDGGVDLKVGQFTADFSAERIDASANMLFSHSYIFNFNYLYKYTGITATMHADHNLDLMAGLVIGANTGSFDDNNNRLALTVAADWKSCDGKYALAAKLHTGPENDSINGEAFDINNSAYRTIFDIVGKVKLCDNLTFINDFSYGVDNGFETEWYGDAMYLVWQMNKCVAAVARLEVFRDDDSFVVAQFADNDDLTNAQHGNLGSFDPRTTTGGPTTYTSLTLGLNIRPYDNLLIRPELRFDWSDMSFGHGGAGDRPFADSNDSSQITLGLDMVWSF